MWWPPEDHRERLNGGKKGICLKHYFARRAGQNVTKFGIKHHWEK